MDGVTMVVLLIVAIGIGLAIGWFAGGREGARMRAERDARTDEFKRAITELAAAEQRANAAEVLRRELDVVRDQHAAADRRIATLEAEARALEARHAELREVRDTLPVHFGAAAAKALETAQTQFLEQAAARFTESEKLSGQRLGALLQPVNDRLQRYEEGVAKIEAERRDAFGTLRGQIDAMRIGQDRVAGEAAKLVNALRNAPKARGRWGEQQLRNVLESCGLSEHADFQQEVSVTDSDGVRLRPDVVVRVPGGKALVIDAKVSLNAYQDAFGAVDEAERQAGLTAHAAAMRAHVQTLGAKAYWAQFDDAPDYVIMFVPGEHFLSAALEHDATLWDFAFDRRVLLATPTNLIAIARTVAAVWRQEKLATEARDIAEAGRELYKRLATMSGHVAKLGRNLGIAAGAYNDMVGSLESQVHTQANRLARMGIDTGKKPVESPPVIETGIRPLTKLAPVDAPAPTDTPALTEAGAE